MIIPMILVPSALGVSMVVFDDAAPLLSLPSPAWLSVVMLIMADAIHQRGASVNAKVKILNSTCFEIGSQ